MSNFIKATKRPDTDKWEDAFWVDNYFDHGKYAVIFADGMIINPDNTDLETGTARVGELTWAKFPESAKKEIEE